MQPVTGPDEETTLTMWAYVQKEKWGVYEETNLRLMQHRVSPVFSFLLTFVFTKNKEDKWVVINEFLCHFIIRWTFLRGKTDSWYLNQPPHPPIYPTLYLSGLLSSSCWKKVITLTYITKRMWHCTTWLINNTEPGQRLLKWTRSRWQKYSHTGTHVRSVLF